MYRKTGKLEELRDGFNIIEQYVVFIYLFCMLGIFPLYYEDWYHQIGNAKFDFFWMVSLYFIGASLIFMVTELVLNKIMHVHHGISKTKVAETTKNFEEKTKQGKLKAVLYNFINSLSNLDYAVLLYAICVILSYAFSDYKEFAVRGEIVKDRGAWHNTVHGVAKSQTQLSD